MTRSSSVNPTVLSSYSDLHSMNHCLFVDAESFAGVVSESFMPADGKYEALHLRSEKFVD